MLEQNKEMTKGLYTLDSSSTQLSPITSVLSFFREHPAIIGSLLYAQVTLIGIVYTYVLYQEFNVNIFDYAETSDFLLAAFRNPLTFTAALITIVLVILVQAVVVQLSNRGETLVRERLRRNFTAVFVASILVILALGVVAALFLAQRRVDELRESSSQPETVQYRAPSGSEEQTTVSNLQLIGNAGTFALFYDPRDETTLVIPHAQIISITE